MGGGGDQPSSEQETEKEEKTETLDLMAEDPKNEPDVKKEETPPSPGFNLFNFSSVYFEIAMKQFRYFYHFLTL